MLFSVWYKYCNKSFYYFQCQFPIMILFIWIMKLGNALQNKIIARYIYFYYLPKLKQLFKDKDLIKTSRTFIYIHIQVTEVKSFCSYSFKLLVPILCTYVENYNCPLKRSFTAKWTINFIRWNFSQNFLMWL